MSFPAPMGIPSLATQAALRFYHYAASSQAKGFPHSASTAPVFTQATVKPPPSMASQLATIALLKLPISFVISSGMNALLFKIPFVKSAGLELLGIAIEAAGTVGITAAKKYYDTHDTTPDTHTSHEKILKLAGAGVSFVSSVITISRCIHESTFFKNLTQLSSKAARVGASVLTGTLCGALEGYLASKIAPWLEKRLERKTTPPG